jgi:hypothetical protein
MKEQAAKLEEQKSVSYRICFAHRKPHPYLAISDDMTCPACDKPNDKNQHLVWVKK